MPATDLAISDLHVQVLASSLVPPGERLVARSVGKKTPWWSCGMLRKTFVVLATDQRMWVLEHRWNPIMGTKLHAVHHLPMANIEAAKVKGLLPWKKSLHLAGQSESALVGGQYLGSAGPFKDTMALPNGFLAPVKRNAENAKTIASTFENSRAFGAGPMAPALPQHAPAMAPMAPMAQPQALQPAYGATPTLPSGYPTPSTVPPPYGAHPHAAAQSSAPPPVQPHYGQQPMMPAHATSGQWPRQ